MSREDPKFRIETREQLFKEQGGRCIYCDEQIIGKPSLDHMVPLNIGGGSYIENFVVCCPECNKSKLDYVVFSNLEDRIIYPMITIPTIFRWSYIQTNKTKKEKI